MKGQFFSLSAGVVNSVSDLLNKDVGGDGATTGIKALEEATEDSTVLHRYQPPHVSWLRRLLNWFRGR